MFYEVLMEKKAEAEQKKKRKGYMREVATLGTVGLGGAALSRLKADPSYMQKRKNVMSIMHSGGGKKSDANLKARRVLKNIRRAKTLGVGAGGVALGLAGKSVYDKYKYNKQRGGKDGQAK